MGMVRRGRTWKLSAPMNFRQQSFARMHVEFRVARPVPFKDRTG